MLILLISFIFLLFFRLKKNLNYSKFQLDAIQETLLLIQEYHLLQKILMFQNFLLISLIKISNFLFILFLRVLISIILNY